MTDTPQRNAERLAARLQMAHSNVFARLASIYSASRMQAQRLLQTGGSLSIVEWRTLWDLHEVGPMTIRDLAATQRTDHSQLSRALPHMHSKGLVSMCRDNEDGRQTIVTLTEAGRKAYAKAAPIMAERRAALRDAFTEEEIEDFLGYLDRLESFLHRPVCDISSKMAQKEHAE